MKSLKSALEMEFDSAMHNIYVRAKKEARYNATIFLQMLHELEGLITAIRLIRSDAPSEGYTKLWEKGRLDLTVEALVIQPKWKDLFVQEDLDRARKRLRDYGYKFEGTV